MCANKNTSKYNCTLLRCWQYFYRLSRPTIFLIQDYADCLEHKCSKRHLNWVIWMHLYVWHTETASVCFTWQAQILCECLQYFTRHRLTFHYHMLQPSQRIIKLWRAECDLWNEGYFVQYASMVYQMYWLTACSRQYCG